MKVDFLVYRFTLNYFILFVLHIQRFLNTIFLVIGGKVKHKKKIILYFWCIGVSEIHHKCQHSYNPQKHYHAPRNTRPPPPYTKPTPQSLQPRHQFPVVPNFGNILTLRMSSFVGQNGIEFNFQSTGEHYKVKCHRPGVFVKKCVSSYFAILLGQI